MSSTVLSLPQQGTRAAKRGLSQTRKASNALGGNITRLFTYKSMAYKNIPSQVALWDPVGEQPSEKSSNSFKCPDFSKLSFTPEERRWGWNSPCRPRISDLEFRHLCCIMPLFSWWWRSWVSLGGERKASC